MPNRDKRPIRAIEDEGWTASLPGTSLTRLPRAAVLAAADARLHAGLLGNYLDVLASAAESGRRLTRGELETFRSLGQAAAEAGVSLPALVDLYLSATWRAWPSLPAVRQADRDARDLDRLAAEVAGSGRTAEALRSAGETLGAVAQTRAAASAVLRASDDVVAAVCEGYDAARIARARAEEALRRELVDDLLAGTSEVGQLLERAAAFGLRLEAPHVVLVVAGNRRFLDGRAVVRSIEAALREQCPTEPLVATKDGLLVCVVPQVVELAPAFEGDAPKGQPTGRPPASPRAAGGAAGTGGGAGSRPGGTPDSGPVSSPGGGPVSGPGSAAAGGSGAAALADGGDAGAARPAGESVSAHGSPPVLLGSVTTPAEHPAPETSGEPGGQGPPRSGVTRAADATPPARHLSPHAVRARPDAGSGHPRPDRPRVPRGRRRLDPPGPGDTGFAPLPTFTPAEATPAKAIAAVTDRLSRESGLVWRLGVSRARTGVAGVRLGYEEARGAVELAELLRLDGRMVHADDLLIYKVLLRDREPLEELVEAVLGPLRSARGGAGPLLETLDAYFATGGVALAAARRLHLSVRALTYRLDRIHRLTRHDPTSPTDRYVLQTAVLGARLLGWEGAGR